MDQVMANQRAQSAIVIIGRNEGERLRRCLESVIGCGRSVVYVDSASSDGSVELARQEGVEVVQLDSSIPFTAARARSAGFAHLLRKFPKLEFVQFVDGDCELVDGWVNRAREAMLPRPEVAVVCGRLRERFSEASVYNRLCDMEWNKPVGETDACGGNAMVRVQAFQQVGGFNASLIAGEESELCVRLRRNGWKIERLDAEMAWHDAATTHFNQWWRRALRAGYAYAEGMSRYGLSSERYCVRETCSILCWAGALPLTGAALAWPTKGLSLLVLVLVYLGLWARITVRTLRRRYSLRDALLYATFCVLGKFPQLVGQFTFLCRRLRGEHSVIIEYKDNIGL